MALTGTPLINDIEDFRAIWQFLGWIDDKKPLGRADGRARGDRADAGRPGLLPRRPQQRHRHGHRPPPQGRRGRRHPGPPDRRPAGRARRRGRPLDPRGRARARPPPGARATRARSATRTSGAGRRGHRPRARTPGRHLGARGHHHHRRRRERLQHDAPHRPGEGRPRRRLRRPARAQRRQGRLLRQAHRRDGRRRGDLRQARASATPRSAATRPRRARQKNIDAFVNDPDVAVVGLLADARPASASTCRSPPTSCSPSCRGPTPSRPRPSTGSTGSVRRSRSPRGASSPRRPSTPGSPSSSTARPASPPGRSTAPTRRSSSSADVQLEALVALLTDALESAA